MPVSLPAGKLPTDLLAALLARLPRHDPRVMLGPGIGYDAAVLDMGDRYLVAKTDPITFATQDIGWYAVNVNANDVACLGARPRWFMVTALLPEGRATAEMAENILARIMDACAELQVSLIGGHTEITHDLSRPILIGAMLGEVAKDHLVTMRGARPGDIVCMTKSIPLEATALIALEKGAELEKAGLPPAVIQSARDLLRNPGISVVREALVAAEEGLATAMHDPTEGGLATGLLELAQAAQVGLEVDVEAIPIHPQGADLCARFGIDPLGAIASGALLLTTKQEHVERLSRLLHASGIPLTPIGRVLTADAGVRIRRGGRTEPLPRFEVDEIARLLSQS